uniref:Uncharacterized protein n=1 Tax=Aegilops tauschii subsp. strangulata TaxID=200361 RepID=A0A453CGN7_AEGTS
RSGSTRICILQKGNELMISGTISSRQNCSNCESEGLTGHLFCAPACRVIGAPPPLPDFSLALTPEDYDLPPLDPLWNKEDGHQ